MSREKDRRQWIAVTVDFFEHPKTLALSDAAQLHVLRLWAYCAQYRTDGLIPEAMLKGRGPKVARELRGGRSWPTTAFYDANGKLNYTKQGSYRTERDLAEDIDRYARP